MVVQDFSVVVRLQFKMLQLILSFAIPIINSFTYICASQIKKEQEDLYKNNKFENQNHTA